MAIEDLVLSLINLFDADADGRGGGRDRACKAACVRSGWGNEKSKEKKLPAAAMMSPSRSDGKPY